MSEPRAILNCIKCDFHFRETHACEGLCPECIHWALVYARVEQLAGMQGSPK